MSAVKKKKKFLKVVYRHENEKKMVHNSLVKAIAVRSVYACLRITHLTDSSRVSTKIKRNVTDSFV